MDFQNPPRIIIILLLSISYSSRSYGCKWGGLRLPAPRPHQSQGHMRAHAAARMPPQVFCGFCGNPRHRPRAPASLELSVRPPHIKTCCWVQGLLACLHMKLWTLKYGEALDHESHLCLVESVAVNIVLERGSADANEVLDLVFMADAWI